MDIKIAHTADIHIGSKCHGIGYKNDLRKHEIKNTFLKILDICNSENIDILLIAGDLFDDVNVSYEEMQSLKDAFKKLKFKIIIAPGNHDPFTPDSPYNSSWPENVYIFKDNSMKYIEFPDLKARIWGTAFNGLYKKQNVLRGIKATDDDVINICLLHGNLCNNESDLYCPISISDIENSNMDYIALGHIHKTNGINKLSKTFYAYSGCPEGRGFDEIGEKGFYIGTVSKNYCDLSFRKICKRTYNVIHIDITSCISENEIINLILNNLRNMYNDDFEKNIYKLILKGFISEDFLINIVKLESQLNEHLFFVKILDSTDIKIDIEKLKFKNDIRSLFIKKMICKIENSKNKHEQDVNLKALKVGLNAFYGDVKYHDN